MSTHRQIVRYCAPRYVCLLAFSFFCGTTGYTAAAVGAVPVILPPAPTLPDVGTNVFNVTVSNPNINGGVTASTGYSDNANAINACINYCSNNGGGTVEVPAGLFRTGTLTMKSNVNLQLDSGAKLQAAIPGSAVITTSGSGLHDIAITGGGAIDGNASVATSNNLVSLQNINRLLISGITIENAGHEHLVPEKDNNVTIMGLNINDDNSINNSQNKTHTYLKNTDGIDYSGSNFLIQNCTIAAGDDDIVAKPANTACTNIVINNCNIISGHGISVGGGTAQGVSNVVVANCTFNPLQGNNQNKNSITFGLRMKAEDGADPQANTPGDFGGGTANRLQNVKYINIKMTNVASPIAIETFYNGSDTFATSPTSTSFYTYGPDGTAPTTISTSTPLWDNIAFINVTATGAKNVLRINGLNVYDPTHPQPGAPVANAIDGLSFSNVHLTGTSPMQLYYAADVDLTGLTIAGTTQSVYGLTNLTDDAVPLLPGDFNRDGSTNAGDLAAMLGALSDLSGYKASQNLSDAQLEVIGDLNNDFTINNSDLQAFMILLKGGFGTTTSVPEPSTFVLAVVAGVCSLLFFRARAMLAGPAWRRQIRLAAPSRLALIVRPTFRKRFGPRCCAARHGPAPEHDLRSIRD